MGDLNGNNLMSHMVDGEHDMSPRPSADKRLHDDNFNNCGISMGPTKDAELRRTAEMLVDIAEKRGVYFAVALLYDSSYGDSGNGRLRDLLPILQKTKGAIKKDFIINPKFQGGLAEKHRIEE